MTDEELIHWLRVGATKAWEKQAADRIEALVKQSADRLALARSEGVARVEQFERAERLEAALREIDALDPEVERIGACSENAIRGLVLRMGEIARSALKGDDHE